MVNGVDIAVGGASGAGFGWIVDGITEVILNAAEFTTSHTSIKSTLEALQPLMQEIEGKNSTLLLQDEELKDLKEEMEAGVKRVQELSEKSVLNYCMRPFYNMELERMDESLKRLLRILQVQGVRDVKEILVQVKEVLVQVKEVVLVQVKEGLVQVNDCKTDVNKISIQLDDCKTEIVKEISIQLDDCKTDVNKISNRLDDCKTEIVEEISSLKDKTTDQLDQVASYGKETLDLSKETLDLTKRVLDQVERSNGRSNFVPIREEVASLVEEEALGSSLLTLCNSVDEALSKPNPHSETLELTERWARMYLARKAFADIINPKSFDEVNTLRIKVEEGTKLIRECSNVVVWTDHNMGIYASKLDDLAKFLEASVQHLKRTNSTMPKGLNSRMHFCSSPFTFSVPWIKSSIDCC